MANVLYKKFKEALLGGAINMSANTIKCVLIDAADYTFSQSHDFLDDVPGGARIGTPQTLGSKTITDGVFDAGNVTFPAVTGDQAEAILIYKDTGDEATSNLIAYIDSATNLPVTPNGGDIVVEWDDGANKIFAI